jgi:hypothetical protein
LPEDTFVRVVREDPVHKGLLYAGTESGLFVSYNDGANWQSLQLNLPPVPVTDLALRHDKLVAATQGRAFWVLDDLFVVRQAAKGVGANGLQLFEPGSVAMTRREGWGIGDFEGSNPERGVPLYYVLDEARDEPLVIEIFDASGEPVRSYSSEESDFDRCLLANMDMRRPFELEYPAKEKGLNKWVWDLRRDGVHCVEDVKIFAGFGGVTAPPGEYRARVSQGDRSAEASFTIVPDPRLTATPGQMREWSARLNETADLLDEVLLRLGEARKAQGQIEGLMADYPDDAGLQQAGQAAVEAITAWDQMLIQHLHETYEDEDAWETMLAGQVRYLLDVIDGTGAPITGGQLERLADLQAEWAQRRGELQTMRDQHLVPLNTWARDRGIEHVAVPGN